MPLFTHILWIASYLIIAVFAGVSLHKGAGLDIFTSSSLGAVLFLLATQLHAALSARRERRDIEDRLMALYRDYQSALDTVEETRHELADFQSEIDRVRHLGRAEFVSEMKVLQTLLAQVAAKSSVRGAADSAKAVNEAEWRAEESRMANYQALSHGALKDEETGEVIGAPPGGTSSGDEPLFTPAPGAGTASERPEIAVPTVSETRDQILNIMHHALEENRVDLYLQPVVSLPSRKVCYYEAFSRVRDDAGHIIFPRQYLPVIEEAGLIGTLDNLLLFRCIQTIRRLGARRPGIKFFCNISPASLEDEEFFPQFVDFMLNNDDLANRLVFEFAETDIARQSNDVMRQLNAMGRKGFALSMDQVTDMTFNFSDLAERYIRFVKIDARTMLSRSRDIHPGDLREAFRRFQIELIVEKIEDEKTVLNLLDHNVGYGQGFLFGEPRLSREPGDMESTA